MRHTAEDLVESNTILNYTHVGSTEDWLRDPRATSFSGTVFLLFDVVLPFLLLTLLVLQQVAPRRQAPAGKACAATRVMCPDGTCRCLAWWSRAQVTSFVRALANSDVIELIPPPWSPQALCQALTMHNVPVERWGDEAKAYFLDELSTGRARFVHKEHKAVRVVDLVLLVVEFAREKCVLQEASRKASLFKPLPEKTPTIRRISSESIQAAARRCLVKKVNIPTEALRVSDTILSIQETMETSDAFPELPSIVRKFVVHVEIVPSDSSMLESIGLPSADVQAELTSAGLTYVWAPGAAAAGLVPHLRESTCFRERWNLDTIDSQHAYQQPILDSCHKAVLPWTEEATAAAMEAHGAPDPKESFGKGLFELAMELSRGHYSLGIRRSDERLLCVQDVFSLLVTTSTGRVLVDAGNTAVREERAGSCPAKFPCTVKLANEDAWTVARRIARSQLGICAQVLQVNEQQLVQQVEPGVYAWECGEKHAKDRRPPDWLLREWAVLSHVPESYRLLGQSIAQSAT